MTQIGGKEVLASWDYSQGLDGLPPSDVLKFQLGGDSSAVIRPSGTEPKIKIYYTTLGKNLEEAEAEKEKLAEALKPIMA